MFYEAVFQEMPEQKFGVRLVKIFNGSSKAFTGSFALCVYLGSLTFVSVRMKKALCEME